MNILISHVVAMSEFQWQPDDKKRMEEVQCILAADGMCDSEFSDLIIVL